MKLIANKVEMKSQLILSEREVEMLGWLAGYEPGILAELIHDKITSKFPKDEWAEFWSEMRKELERARARFRDTRHVFEGTKVAKELQ